MKAPRSQWAVRGCMQHRHQLGGQHRVMTSHTTQVSDWPLIISITDSRRAHSSPLAPILAHLRPSQRRHVTASAAHLPPMLPRHSAPCTALAHLLVSRTPPVSCAPPVSRTACLSRAACLSHVACLSRVACLSCVALPHETWPSLHMLYINVLDYIIE